jgi:hypothetical protein
MAAGLGSGSSVEVQTAARIARRARLGSKGMRSERHPRCRARRRFRSRGLSTSKISSTPPMPPRSRRRKLFIAVLTEPTWSSSNTTGSRSAARHRRARAARLATPRVGTVGKARSSALVMSSNERVIGARAHARSARRPWIEAASVVLPLPTGPHKTRCSPLLSLSASFCATQPRPRVRVGAMGSFPDGRLSPTAARVVEQIDFVETMHL